MKRQLTLVTVILSLLMGSTSLMAIASGDIQATQSISIGSSTLSDAVSDLAGLWLTDHWAYIALIASELLAFVPSKFNGLAQAVFKIGQSIFGKKKNSELLNP